MSLSPYSVCQNKFIKSSPHLRERELSSISQRKEYQRICEYTGWEKESLHLFLLKITINNDTRIDCFTYNCKPTFYTHPVFQAQHLPVGNDSSAIIMHLTSTVLSWTQGLACEQIQPGLPSTMMVHSLFNPRDISTVIYHNIFTFCALPNPYICSPDFLCLEYISKKFPHLTIYS